MGKILMINGSPRAPRSNSKRYAEWFARVCPLETEYRPLTKTNHMELCRAMDEASDVLFVFPLYADGIPVTLLNFLKTLEDHPPSHRPTISVLINCGFLEPHQNDIAVQMVKLFAGKNDYPFGSVLKIGSGEAILSPPFRGLVGRGLKKLSRAIAGGRCQVIEVTMPLPKRVFIRASGRYWESYGKRNGVTKAQMETLAIEDQLL